jgi:glucan phosphoethanolaminetransferase (alkaline phosphatase superfamily)
VYRQRRGENRPVSVQVRVPGAGESTLYKEARMISLVVTLVVIGVLLYFLNVYLPMDAKIKQILNVVVVICVVVWLLYAFGVLGHADVPVPQLR